ncbi:MAG: DUF3857 and transglutaminase domain-containing protein [Bacteroidales bacterium]|nr:DUF3857 and transglutaminase domain-containing protein [Bacteroidales bacterium]
MSILTRIFITLVLVSYSICLVAQTPDAELVYHETKIQVKRDNLHKTVLFEIKINNRAGDKYTDVVIQYSSMRKVSNINAIVKDSNGKIVKKLKKGDIEDRSAFSDYFYEDEFVKEFTLRHNIYPYTLSYSYEIEQNEFIFIDYWLPVLDYDIPTLKAKLFLKIPVGYNIEYTEQFVNKPKVDSLDFNNQYTWETDYTDLMEPEIASPPSSNFLPKVVIVPKEFNYSVDGSFDSWVSFGNWQNKLNKNLSDLTESDSRHILSLVEGISDEKEKVKILYHYLQDNTRYINVSIETGGLKPYPASYVAENKYGDCKALSNYFIAVLNVIGIDAYYTKVFAGDKIEKVNKEFPSHQSNHIILNIPLLNDTIWLDCTSDGPFGYQGTFTQNRDAFVICDNNSHFQRTPSLNNNDVLETRNIKVYTYQNEKARAHFYNAYKGEDYEFIHYLNNSINETRRNQIIKKYYVESDFEADEIVVKELFRDSAEIQLSYTAESNNIYKRYGNEIIVEVLAINTPNFEKPGKRKLPVQLNYPVYKIDTLEYEIIDGYQITNTLVNRCIETKYGKYNIEFHQKSNIVLIIKEFLLNSGNYTISEYKGLYDFIQEVNTIEKNNYIVTEKKN